VTLPFELSRKLIGAYGALPASRMIRSADRVIAVPFEFDTRGEGLPAVRVAVFAHVFYPELSNEIVEAVHNISVDFDLFVSTDSREKEVEISRHLQWLDPKRRQIRILPNRGRNVAPFIIGFKDEITQYDIICHLHTKKSKHDDILSGWREYTFRQLLGSREIVDSIIYTLRSGEADLLFPDHYGPVVQSLNFGYDFELMASLLGRLNIKFSKDVLFDFPSGSMFWARSRVLAALLSLNLQFEDFPEEAGQIDGTLAHAIERTFLFLAEAAGGRWSKVIQPADCHIKSRLVPVCSPEDIPLAITRASRRLLGNRVSINVQPRSIPEIPSVGFRGEKSLRPRITLLIPTLRPEKIYGGVASALRLFNQLVATLPAEFDARIISVQDEVDADCMATVSDYTNIALGAENTELSRTIVDASGVRAAQLPIRRKDIFLATAWWTAYFGFEIRQMQESLYGAVPPLYYFIQDHEPDFYGWSPRYALARSTYLRKGEMRAIINSEELYNFFAKNYGFHDAYYIPYAVNQVLRKSFLAVPKDRIILVYARPSTPRNAFEILVDGLCLWQQANPVIARSWRIVAAGEDFEPWRAEHVSNFEIVGKLSLDDYADVLCRAAVGISLMISPHPSYPPLEMAEAGMVTITNNYGEKDLTLRSDNILSLEMLTPQPLAVQIAQAVARAEPTIGQAAQFRPVAPIPCKGKIFSEAAVVQSIKNDLP
jgi:Rhamnan synthesis protein F